MIHIQLGYNLKGGTNKREFNMGHIWSDFELAEVIIQYFDYQKN